jgi:hypothetical protein
VDYVYVGWGPEVDPEGEIVRPGDEREFDEQPTWGRWAAVVPPEAAAPAPAPPTPTPPAVGLSALATPPAKEF